MDWIKVKVSHSLYEYENLSDNEYKAWIKAMSITALIEKMPTEAQLLQHIHKSTLKSLQTKLKLGSNSLQTILKKVLEDVQYTQHLKAKNRSKIAEWRHKHSQCNQLPVTITEPVTLPDKIREEKIREDNIIVCRFDEFWKAYPKPIGQSMALITYRATVKTDKDFQDLMTALKNYLASDEVKRGFIKNGSTWIEDWRGWLTMIPKKTDPLDKWVVKEKR